MDSADASNSLNLPEEEGRQVHNLASRAYQIEMFEQSMQENIIVTMDTGSGKTQIARLRIEAELERSPQKRIWFCAPNVVLAQQQHIFLASQLPSYQLRLITGHDNVKFWSTQDVWDAVLCQIDIVVSTPQVLLDALSHGFVSLRDVSLLIFDEAHHCVANSPMAHIMHRFYHPLRNSSDGHLTPNVLGLTASPITNKASKLHELEANMNCVCKTPTLQVDDYKKHVHLPVLDRIPYKSSVMVHSPLLRALDNLVAGLPLREDPTVRWLLNKKQRSTALEQKLEKIRDSGKTPVLKQLGSFLGHAQHICDNIGPWAADLYIRTCASKLHDAIARNESILSSLADQEQQYMDVKLQSLPNITRFDLDLPVVGQLIAPKTQAVIEYLTQQYQPGVTVIVFVKRRSAVFALTNLLQSCSQIKDYSVFSFVGVANPAHRSLFDLADMQLQREAFADFQQGKRNICVATQVMEEGVDVQATNLVIRFDEPENFRSFVQSRGRARRPDSKFAMVHLEEESTQHVKISNWKELECLMKEQYSDLTRTMLDQQAIENEDEDGNEFYRVESTGALLTYDNARQHLENFCATLPLLDDLQPAQPVLIITKLPTDRKSARVILPASVAVNLQVTNSLRTWRTEKMARNDAAFQTYKKLHTANLVNDNLLPFPRIKKQNEKLETRDSLYEVQTALNPWILLSRRFPESSYIYPHHVKVSGLNFAYPDLILYMPVQLDTELSFELYSAISGRIEVEVKPEEHPVLTQVELARQVTSFLFTIILGRRLKRYNNTGRLPYLVLPAAYSSNPSAWFERAQSTTPLSELVFSDSLEHRSYLLRRNQDEIPYIWNPTFENHGARRYHPSETIVAERLSRQMSFFEDNQQDSRSKEWVKPDLRSLPVDECHVLGLSAGYGSFMLLMPSICHMLEIALRGQLAVEQEPLNGIGFSNSHLVSKALTSSSASSTHNFESLEFVGDSLLKYYASIHVFFSYPELTEGGLNAKYAKIVNNARLQRATKELGLDAYMTLERFSSAKWTLAMTDDIENKRRISSKTLADVIEALIGAAYLDPQNTPSKDDLPISALSKLFSDVDWKSPSSHVQDFHRKNLNLQTNIARLTDIEDILKYEFRYKPLLLEALTRTSPRVGAQSFQRLEFLGDAILDRIVNVALYRSGFGLDPEHLKYRRDALVNRWLLSFLAMNAQHIVITNDIETTPTGVMSTRQNIKTVRLVDHMRTSSDRAEQLQRRKAETTFLLAYDEIISSLTSGSTFPWTALHSIDTSKSYSDMFEALLAAVYIDSGGSLDTCEHVLDALGLLPILRRLATERGLDVRQPIVMLRLKVPDVVVEEKDSGKLKDDSRRWNCRIFLRAGDATEVAGVAESAVSQKHAEACAAELALEYLVKKARDDGIEAQGKDVDEGEAMDVD